MSYSIATQTPQYRVDSLQDLENIPVTGPSGSRYEILANMASIRRGAGLAVVSHYDIQPLIDIYGTVQGRDLGGVARDLNKIVEASKKELPRGSQLIVRGQIQTMRSSYTGLLSGLLFSIVLVYLLIVVNFQSWLDPFIIISALPAALAGIVWFLFITRTTLSVPALTGSIMCMGVATANSILVVSFAKEQLDRGQRRACSRPDCRVHAFPSGADDGPRYDHRDGPYGDWTGRGRRTECSTWPGSHWRSIIRHSSDFIFRAGFLQHPARAQGAPG